VKANQTPATNDGCAAFAPRHPRTGELAREAMENPEMKKIIGAALRTKTDGQGFVPIVGMRAVVQFGGPQGRSPVWASLSQAGQGDPGKILAVGDLGGDHHGHAYLAVVEVETEIEFPPCDVSEFLKVSYNMGSNPLPRLRELFGGQWVFGPSEAELRASTAAWFVSIPSWTVSAGTSVAWIGK